ncbi:type II toxin-antitoxin system HicA family toxin [Mycetocola tolaasinivorans]|uniref:Type II toxin-antitoxin system HicA family toxin n=1 Tax=Mycetocola tolaasinivorans TaxID=76635 RepID=A0A3L7A740_9MICO|nr:type II toxin-antitoxin system HicA family toxin [Mycetocola tolaasinivorans]RLP76139.1 type II toxin-antitoxin system HicA family toxin [Mycetocola tolaasinivorans]
MKDAKRKDVERFLLSQGYRIDRDRGPHTWWKRLGSRSVPIPRHRVISAGVLRTIEQLVGFVSDEWK